MHKSAYVLQNLFKARLYHVLRLTLPQSRRTAIKRMLASSRKRFRKAYLLRYGTFTAKQIVADLAKKIPDVTEIVMVHSAYDRLLPMYSGTPEELVNELIAFCGNERTLAMPAFFLGGRTYDALGYYRARPFDVRRTNSEMGLLTEIFRRKPGVKRSLHPTHSVCAFGPRADELTNNHHLASTRTGKGTPFETMTRRPTAIVGLGVEYYRCLTQTHTAEDLMGDEFPIEFTRVTAPVQMINYDGSTVPFDLTVLRCATPLDNTLLRSLLNADELVEWKFHGVALFVTNAQRVTESLIDAARKGMTVFGRAN